MAYTDWQGISGIGDFFSTLNTNTSGAFGVGAWVISLVVMWTVFTAVSARGGSQTPAKDGFVGSSFVLTIAGIPMTALGLIPVYLEAVAIVLSVISIIVLSQEKG